MNIDSKSVVVFLIIALVMVFGFVVFTNFDTIFAWCKDAVCTYGIPYVLGVITMIVAQVIAHK